MTHINGPGLSSVPRVQSWVLSLVERIIRAANRERPADGVLRAELRAQCGLSQEEGGQVSRAVFAYFRWRGWLEAGKPIPKQIEAALTLAERFANQPDSFTDAEMLTLAVPGWLPTVMEASAPWVRSLQAEPRLWLRARCGQGRAVAGRLGHCRAFGEGPLADALDYRGRSDLFRTKEFHAGQFELQDISSQAVGLICDPRPGETWWDACAGEGGKTVHLSTLMGNKGLIWASDRAPWRLANLKRRAARAEVFNYRAVVWDGGPRLPTRTKFDGVLVDAPCSGIGTWQRNPHARWTTTAQDVKELGEVQTQLLLKAAAGVKPGGKLVYAACTLAHLETTGVLQAFEAQSPLFERLAVSNPLVPGSPPREVLFLWPQETSGNGMCVAAWVRKSA
ncbi:MAG: RsmB/NOP family class I SAM-dependent RNA methyltransferase [Verrucomicrobiota bacterium]